MYDDHGTLRDDANQPLAYSVLVPGQRNVPLMESQVWPEDMLLVNLYRNGRIEKVPPPPGRKCNAESFADDIETLAARYFRALPCAGNHAEPTTPCPECGAVR